jgi:hypothetical protein
VALIVAAAVFEEVKVTLLVRFCVELSLNVPVAVNCCVKPATMLDAVGVTVIDTKVAAVTVSVEVPAIVPLFAVIVVVPTAAA